MGCAIAATAPTKAQPLSARTRAPPGAAAARTRAEVGAGRRARDEYASRGSPPVTITPRAAPHAAYKALDGQCFHSSEPGSEFTYEIASTSPPREGREATADSQPRQYVGWQVPPHSSSGAGGDGVVGIYRAVKCA